MHTRFTPLSHVLALATALALLAAAAGAATYTWTGGSPLNGQWSTAGNWDAAGVPVSASTTDLVFSTNTGGATSVNNLAANPFVVNSLSFGAGLVAPFTVFSANPIRFHFSTNQTITQSSASKVTIAAPINFGATNRDLQFTGTGTGDIEVSGVYYFPHQSTMTVNAARGGDVILNQVDFWTRSSYFYNKMPVASGNELVLNGPLRFTAVNDPTTIGFYDVGRTVINGQFVHVGAAGGGVDLNPSTNGIVVLNNPAGNFADPTNVSIGAAGGTVDLGGYTHTVRTATFNAANVTNGILAVQDFNFTTGTLNVAVTDAPGSAGNLTKTIVTNNDAWINAACTHTGVTRLLASDITLQNSGSVANSRVEFDVVPVNGETSRLILSNTAVNLTDRLSDTKPITMRGGELHLVGNAGAATPEVVGDVTFSRYTAIRVDAAGGGVASLTGASITRANYGTMYITGDSLGNAAGPNVAQVLFAAAPATTAGSLGTTGAPVVPWAVGDNSYNVNYALMLTYDPATGFRPLSASEYVANSPTAGANNYITVNTNLTADTAMKSLCMRPAANGTYTLGGAYNLTVTDGVIIGGLSNQGPANVISTATLTFGPNSVTGYEGIIHSISSGGLTINSNIIDNGGNAVSLTKSGPQRLTLSGNNSLGGTLRVWEGQLQIGANTTAVQDIVLDSSGSGSIDIAVGAQLTTTGSGTVLTINRPNNGAAMTGGGTLTLSGNVLVVAAIGSQNSAITVAPSISLGAGARTVTVDDGPNIVDLVLTGAIGGAGGLTKDGAGAMSLQGAGNYTGATTISRGQLYLQGASGTVVSSASVTADWATYLGLDSNAANNSNRLGDSAPVTLRGAELRLTGFATAGNPTQEDSGAITLNGQATISLDAQGGGVTSLTADSFSRPVGSALLLRGDNLGAAAAANVGQLFLSSAPTLVGTGALGTTSAPILPYVFGDTNIGATGSRETGSLVTYDANGFRLLSRTTEMASGGTLLANTNWFGAGSIAANTAVNSIFMQNSGTISGAAGTLLTVTSGAIMHASGYDTLSITVPQLTFGNNAVTGCEGIVYVNRIGSGTTSISSAIVDNGASAAALTKAGGGILTLSGATANTYTGPTNLTAGTLLMNKTHTGGGSYTVRGGATLGGTGTIDPATGATVTLGGVPAAYAVLSPGNSIGTITIGASGSPNDLVLNDYSRLLIETDNNGGSDQVIVWGNVSLGDNVALSVVGPQWFNGIYTLLAANGGSVTGMFNPALISGVPSYYQVFYGADSIQLIPEPGALALFGLAAAMLLRRRRAR